MSKKKSTQTQTNSYQYLPPPETADTAALRSRQFQEDPGIGHQFALLKEQLHNSYQNPLGQYTTADVRGKQMRASDQQVNQEEAAAHRAGQYDVNQQTYGRDLALAGLTQPKLVQTGGTSTATQSGNVLDSVIGGGANVAAAALM